ncbi:hypothetical protein [Streptomyces sp. NPDC051994]|uniref:hypothetical protein n=1 Tax=unclassified Streptomyces TaxID=2593676 RepID=UPI0034348650
MLGDPGGNRLVAGQSPKPGQRVVEFLVEVADPSEAPENCYTINGLLVSDFFTPNFYDPVAAPGVRYSFTGAVDGPRKILSGGYISWHDPVGDHWWQQAWFGTQEPVFRDLGRLTARAGSLRSAIDSRTETISRIANSGPQSALFATALTRTAAVKEATAARADRWSGRIEELQSQPVVEGTWEGGEQNNAQHQAAQDGGRTMAGDEKRGQDRADELQEVIDQLTSGAAAPGGAAPTGPHGESLREIVHRRMHQLDAEAKAEQERTVTAPESDDDSS